jgi:hypothetical protein
MERKIVAHPIDLGICSGRELRAGAPKAAVNRDCGTPLLTRGKRRDRVLGQIDILLHGSAAWTH